MARSFYAFSVATALLAAACGPALAQDDDSTASILRDCSGTLSGRTLDSCLERARVADQTDPSPDIAALLARLEQQAKAEDGTPSASSPPPAGPDYGPPDNGPPDQGPPYDDDEYGPPPPPDNAPGAGPNDQDQPEAAPDDDYPQASPDDGPDDEEQPPPDLPDPPPGDDGY